MQDDHIDADPLDGRDESAAERSDRNWNDVLQELRVTQTGTQIISGFLLTVAFQQRFRELNTAEDVVYGVLVALAAASTLVGLSVVSLHRAQFRRHDKPTVVSVANRLLVAGLWLVAALTSGVVFLLFDFVFSVTAGVIAAALALIAVAAVMAVLPRSLDRNRDRDSTDTSNGPTDV
ncbi:MAG TPA: DUF6328 family protein [Galbitalea sp.]|nr:DUF6328 family protein [Galbitalea sp.]